MGDAEANSGTATGGGDYDVFLSFRGPDTRNKFTDCLYEFMSDAGIRIFRDDEELRPGEMISEILRAVKRSQIYIPIFSEDYASSKWCLRELTCMVECTRQPTGKEILPIFYDVDPSDVKLETELYKRALRKHEEILGCTEVKPWKEALETVAKIKGWHMKDQRQGKVIKDIIQKVSQSIAMKRRDLPIDLIGIDDRIEAIEKLLDCDISDVRFVIIHGIGGIGKTSLAKAVFNQLSPRFEGHSFLSNIRESSSSNGVTKLQRKLVADLFNFSIPKTFDFEEGNNMIRKRLPTKRVLLVFDNMDENDQFLQLAMNSYLCGPGSRIIITTRDKSISPKTKLEGLEEKILMGSTKVFLYEMKEMHFDHALQLFNKLAFNANAAPCDLLDLSREVVELTGGLPLALEVIGSHLRTMNKAKWKSTLKKLKEVPLEKVQQSLKISYDALGYEAQQVFLDIACFFVDKKITNAMYLWEACDLFPKVEIDILISKSLIKIDHDKIWMHDQLRDLGRAIVRQENIEKPGERSRVGFLETALDIVRARKGTENVVALALWRLRHDLTREDFMNLMNVRFLELDGGNFAGNFEEILPELRWLCWRNCPPKLRANNFVLNHLVVLKLSGHITAEEWSGWAKIMVSSKLKVLKIAGSKSLMKTPCFSELTSLERLILKDFPRLTQIDCSIGKLERLIYLKIKWCPRLRELPEDIGHLTALRELILIQGFSVRYLPNSIGNLRGLSRLVMEDTGLVELPDTIKGQADLEYLCLANCTSLKSLPDAVGELKLLTELDLSGTTIEELPHSIWNRGDLTLRMNSSKIRMQLMTDLPLLEGIKDCWDPMGRGAVSESTPKKLKGVPQNKIRHWLEISYEALEYGAKQIFLDIACFFVNAKKIEAMYMWQACNLFSEVEVDVLVNQSLIKIVNDRIWMHDQVIDFGREIVRRENIGKFGDRSRSWLPKMAPDIIQAKRGAENVEALTLWKLRHNYNLTPEDCANLRDMRFLELDGQNFAGNFKIILPELRWLCWRNCPPKLQANNFVLNHLVVLKLSGDFTTEEWSKWVEIMVASKLKVLNLAGSKSLIKTPCFSEFTSLERLVLKDLPNLVEIDRSIGKLEQLIYLQIKCCPLLRELPQEIGCLCALRELILIKCYGVRYLPDSIGNLRLLSKLIMPGAGLVELPDTIEKLVELQHCPEEEAKKPRTAAQERNEFGDCIFVDVEDCQASSENQPVPMSLEIPESRLDDHMEEVEMEDIVDEEEGEEEPIMDIDGRDKKNQLAVVDYIGDIYAHYRRMENCSCVSANYMGQQADINEKMRAILIDWLIEVHDKLDLMHETLFLTVNLIDRFLAQQSVVRKKLQLVGLVAMLLACKYEEVYVPDVGDLILKSDKSYTRKEVLEMEILMLNSLQFNMSLPTPYVFMRRFLKAAESDKKLEVLSFFLIELSLVEYEMLKFPPSLLAAAAIFTAQCTLYSFKQWTKTCEWHSNYTEDQLLECARMMVGFHQKAATGRLTGVHRKYCTSKFGYTSECEPANFLLGEMKNP